MFHASVLIGACLPLVSASIYPTQPVQATVWTADQPMLVSWTEDWKYPQLSAMGPLDIFLWSDTDTYLAPLASGVDPMAKTCQVTVPPRVVRRASKLSWNLLGAFIEIQRRGVTVTEEDEAGSRMMAVSNGMVNLRFTTSQPIAMTVYSADFLIVPANTTSAGSPVVALATQSGTGAGTGTGTASVPTTAGSASTSTTTGASARFGSTTSSGIPPPSGTIPASGVPAVAHAASAGRRGVDVEKLKFRFVFVIWPVLMGITMAL